MPRPSLLIKPDVVMRAKGCISDIEEGFRTHRRDSRRADLSLVEQSALVKVKVKLVAAFRTL
jgi:hypothetical protein